MKITNILLIICLQLLCAVIPPAYGEEMETASALKIRAAYWNIKPIDQAEEQFRLLKQHGLNTAIVSDGKYRLQENLWRGWGKIAGKHDIQLFAVLNFAVPGELKPLQEKYTPYVNRHGTVRHATPCPLDASYWHAVIGQRLEQLAQLSKTTQIAGVLFDTEMYGSDFSIYGTDPCFCDSCWKEFVQAAERQDAHNLPGEQRFDYLIQYQLFQRYSTFQSKRVQDILSRIERQVHSINPHLLLGFLGYRNNWFYAGLIRGLGTTSRPVMVFSESTYVRGYTAYADKEKRAIEKAAEGRSPENKKQKVKGESRVEENTSSIARYVPGLWLGRFFPEELSSQLYTLARHTDGYWIYTADSLWTAEPKPRGYALHGSNEECWIALKRTNDELQHFSKAPGSFQSSIPLVPHLSSFHDTSQNRLVTNPLLKQFIHQIKLRETAVQNVSEITYRDKTLFHFFNKKGGTIKIAYIPIGKYKGYTRYRLFDRDGLLLREGIVDHPYRPVTITLPANISGLVSLLTDAGANATQVSFSGLPFIVEASSTFPLTTINPEHIYAFYVKPEKKKVKLRAYCSKDESAYITIQSPDDTTYQKINIIEFTEMYIPIGNNFRNNRNFWAIAVNSASSKSYGEVRFYFYDEEFPYLITMPQYKR